MAIHYIFKQVLVLLILAVFMNSCNQELGKSSLTTVQQAKAGPIPSVSEIRIRRGNYSDNLSLNNNDLFDISGADTILKVKEGENWINTGATVGSSDTTYPSSYIYFTIKNGRIINYSPKASAWVLDSGKTLQFNTGKIKIDPGQYHLCYYLSTQHRSGNFISYEHVHELYLIKGLIYNLNDYGYTDDRSYFYFRLLGNGKMDLWDYKVSRQSDTNAYVEGSTLHLKTIVLKLSPKKFSTSGRPITLRNGDRSVINIRKDTCIYFIRGLHALVSVGTHDSELYPIRNDRGCGFCK